MSFDRELKAAAARRGVQLLFHYTQIANLPGIVKNGILPRSELAHMDCTAYASDRYRLDENDAAVSVSISRVNDGLFASKRQKSGHSDWVVLALSPEILWTQSCQFCWTNAAKNEIRNHRGWRRGPWAFAEMFAGNREERKHLPSDYPTHPEAEVQVLERIPPHHILAAAVNRKEVVQPVAEILSALGRPVSVVIDGSFYP